MSTRTPVADAYSAAHETNPLWYDHSDVIQDRLTLADVAKAGGKIVRLRMFFEGRVADISYCHARLADGTLHSVDTSMLMLHQPFTVSTDLIAWSKAQGVFGKGIGLLDKQNWSVLR